MQRPSPIRPHTFECSFPLCPVRSPVPIPYHSYYIHASMSRDDHIVEPCGDVLVQDDLYCGGRGVCLCLRSCCLWSSLSTAQPIPFASSHSRILMSLASARVKPSLIYSHTRTCKAGCGSSKREGILVFSWAIRKTRVSVQLIKFSYRLHWFLTGKELYYIFEYMEMFRT